MNNFKVLMTLMGLEIGGAETHVLELCKALRKTGVQVYVASNGGAYEAELAEWGVIHFRVPLHNKNVANVISAYGALKRIIRENDIKLVHAHARIPAFLCGLLKRKLGIRFVTTAHWTFVTRFPFNVLTNWGERSLAVSKDIKQYLVDNYNFPQEHIKITINGIDTDKFSGDIDYGDIAEEFALEPGAFRVVYVSRLDKERSLAAHALIEAVPAVMAKCPHLEVVIVGNGDDYGKVADAAKAANEAAGRRVVVMAGARVDVNKFAAACDTFVGVSRSALEAMAAAKPVILAGNEGYLGIFNESTLEKGVETNFCCRGCKDTSAALIAEDLLGLVGKTAEERAALGDFGREVVSREYSTARMAADALEVYESVRTSTREIDVLISGYYGFGNNGDDAVLKSIVDNLKAERPSLRIVVLSKNPPKTEAEYGVRSIFRFNFWRVRAHLRNTRLLITGGGTLLQDLTSTQSLLYYLWVINTAVRSGARTMLYGNGIGPIRGVANNERVRRTIKRIDMITLRDENSLEVLRGFELAPNARLALTADAAFALMPLDAARIEQVLGGFGLTGERYFVISVRNWKHIARSFEEDIAAYADYVAETYGLTPLFVAMQPENDTEMSRRIAARMKSRSRVFEQALSTDQYVSISAGAVFIAAMRLHVVIYGAKTGTPCIGLVYDPKVTAMMHMMGQTCYTPVERPDTEALKQFTAEIMENREQISAQITARMEAVLERARENTRHALELLDTPEF
ncbi:MAG: polysaccharide pyruvyl transferase CsaB [Defluviitaleaceae bacterium]|nr:polysaccharide pyruvyl transferase CsaB [Defluviitaleaceae bacterium]